MTEQRKRGWRQLGVGLVAAAALIGAGIVAAPATAAEPTINGYRNVGYFAQWGVYARDFKLKQL